ncbi:hypothetical protein ACT2FY_01235 [Paraburkholderia fungorum]|uniref:hypothetical protein n=1 Tax=Paraburkholderia fungorum TaxID=134537 RepID=UPI00402BB547
MPEHRLTWHVGSVLPYASLWHTVLRACALNALHARDLPSCLPRSPATVELLGNDAGGVDMAAFAHALGEVPSVFQWSTLGALPPWLRGALAVPQPRLCFACLAAGYHTALFSIDLLEVCPIHRTPLVDRCHCGAPSHTTLRSLADYGTAGSCRCGRLHFFTRETCRRPTLTPDRTRAFDPLAAWLDELSRLIRPARLEEALWQRTPGSLEWLVNTARTLGIAYPACLRPVSVARAPVETVWYGARLKATSQRDRPPPSRGAQEDERPPYWQATPATIVYRALARHVRRHRAPGEAQWVAGFMDACDPIEIGERICCSRQAQQAFIAMLWARAIEPGIEQRRWPDRAPPTGTRGRLAERVAADCRVRGTEGADPGTRHWLACHAARVSLSAAWRDAQARATAAARLGLADWAHASPGTSWCASAWLARVTPLGVRFVAPITGTCSAAPHFGKALRQAAYAARQRERRDVMWATSRGACLTWSQETGWHVIEAIAPADCDLRRRRLLGLKEGRPWCWLYQAIDGRFVARWNNAPLQVWAATPDAAIMALRHCATDYRRICQVVLPSASSAPAVTPEPVAARLATDYQFFVAVVRCKRGFWREAGMLAEAARNYRRAQGLARCTEAGCATGAAG